MIEFLKSFYFGLNHNDFGNLLFLGCLIVEKIF